MQGEDTSEEKIGLPHAFGENVLSFLPMNILPLQLQIGLPPFPIWDRQLKAQRICLALQFLGKEVNDSRVVYEVQLYIQRA